MSEPTFEQLAATYVKLRDIRAERTKAYEEADAAIKADMHRLEVTLLGKLQADGISSVKTDAGTVYRQEEITPTCADWDAFYSWMVQDKARLEGLQRRIKKEFIKTYMDENKDEDDLPKLPPGVSVLREYVVRVRRN